ncbi:MAG TPA: methyltransferase domain-containing protein [Planctomycetota bacterium]|nr:methyltransferase domain-containing protein [Planctomycetota bacterium]
MDAVPLDWQRAYREGVTPWDLRGPTPALLALLHGPVLVEAGVRSGARVAVPGCGRGHDVRVFAQRGFDVTGFDIVPDAVEEARALLSLNRVRARVLCRDVLGLLPEFEGSFDLVYDYTCYCALRPYLRSSYARVLAGLLRPNGLVLHLAFPMRADAAGKDGRPPYLITVTDLHESFDACFALERELPAEDSVPERRGAERWYLWRKRREQ